MKKILALLVVLVSVLCIQAQSPTKTETVNYLDKRIYETIGHQIIWKTGTVEFVNEARFFGTSSIYTTGRYNFLYRKKDNVWTWNHFDFDPEFIQSVTDASGNTASNSPVGFIAITFSNNLIKKESRNYWHNGAVNVADYNFPFTTKEKGNVSVVYLPYLKQDPTAFERIKKAILHLKTFHLHADPFAD